MLHFSGEYDLTLDSKHRLSIPAKVREQVDVETYGSAFYVKFNFSGILTIYPDKYYYQRIALAVAPRMAAPEELIAYERINSALAGRVELDRQGRLLLNDKAIRRAGIKERVTLIGVRDHLELWDAEYWDQYLAENLASCERIQMQSELEQMERFKVDQLKALQEQDEREEELAKARAAQAGQFRGHDGSEF